MRIIIDIPGEFDSDYKGDMFKDFFSRVLVDIEDAVVCGNYEKEITEMFLKAFDESIPMDRIIESLEEYKNWYISHGCSEDLNRGIIGATNHAIEIVKGGGKV